MTNNPPASLEALGIKPVAWLYNCDGDVWTAALEPEPIVEDDWTETPLYSATDLAPLIAKARRVEALEAALRPFAFLEMEKDEGLADTQYVWEAIYADRVQDWFSYDEISAARAALKENTDATSN